jgi:hypothetical protein
VITIGILMTCSSCSRQVPADALFCPACGQPVAEANAQSAAQVTVTGPDGVEFYDFGDSDGSITITQTDGELSVVSDGDVTVGSFEGLEPEQFRRTG